MLTKQKIHLWQNSKTQILTKLNIKNCDQTQKLKLWQIWTAQMWLNSTNQIVTSQIVTNSVTNQFLAKCLLLKTTWHLANQWDVLVAAFCDLAMLAPVISKCTSYQNHKPSFKCICHTKKGCTINRELIHTLIYTAML